jgi:hypothetical protein
VESASQVGDGRNQRCLCERVRERGDAQDQ